MFALIEEKLYTPVVGDIPDVMGYSHRFLSVTIRPLRDGMKAAGKACTILECNVCQAQKRPFGLLTEALDRLEKNEIHITADAHNNATRGETSTATARVRGAVDAVLDGHTRDTPQALEQDFPVFATGRQAQDSSMRINVIDFRCIIEIGGVIIHDDDLVFGDMDGVPIIPKEAAIQCVEDVLEKAVGGEQVRKAIESGVSTIEAFHKFGTL